jgi:hypoxanthine phosphoribosyltransferase
MFKDKTKLLISRDEISKICKDLGAQISKDYNGQEILVICVLKGSIIFVADLIREITLPLTVDFMRASSYGNSTTSSGNVRILKDVSVDIKDKHVLLVEDILDTGHTLTFLTKHLLASKPASLKLCTLLDKPSRRVAAISADYVGRKIDDLFVVGYGLDYQQLCRNYPDIHIVEA